MTKILVLVVVTAVLPTLTNVVGPKLPGSWGTYLWLAWPLTLVLVAARAAVRARRADAESSCVGR